MALTLISLSLSACADTAAGRGARTAIEPTDSNGNRKPDTWKYMHGVRVVRGSGNFQRVKR